MDWQTIYMQVNQWLEPFDNRYLAVVILLMIAYRLGFARKLPLLKSLIVYFLLVVGCLPLVILSYGLPIIPTLVIAIFFLLLVRFRQKRYQPAENSRPKGGE